MRAGWIAALVVALVGTASAQEPLPTFDWELALDATAEDIVAACADTPAICEDAKQQCASVTGYAHGTNIRLICGALGFTLADEDLRSSYADRIRLECSADPQGVYCASIGPMCLRNEAEGWPHPTIRDTCGEARDLGATWPAWATETPVPFQEEWGPDNLLDIDPKPAVDCTAEPALCEEARQVCREMLDRRGGFLWGSEAADWCLQHGVTAPAIDLLEGELLGAQRWCAEQPEAGLCTSLRRPCREYDVPDPPTGFPRLAEACAAYWVEHPPPRIRNSPSMTGASLAIALGRPDADDADATLALDAMMHSVNGRGPLGLGWLARTALGSTTGGGFLYDLGIGLGAGVRFGDEGLVTATIGGGLGGITGGRLGFAWAVPVELHAGIPLGPVRLSLGARGSWLFKEDARQDGSTSLSIFDEVEVRAGLAFRRNARSIWGVHAFAGEAREARILGVALSITAVVTESGEPRRHQ